MQYVENAKMSKILLTFTLVCSIIISETKTQNKILKGSVIMTIKEVAMKKAEMFKAENGDSYLIAISDTRNTVAIHEISVDVFPTLDIFTMTEKEKTVKLTIRAIKEWKKTIETFPKVATFDREVIDKALEKGQTEKGKSKVNYGHALEHILFNTSFTEILASKSEVDGKFNGKNVQVKASLVTWNKVTGKNNSASVATVCEMNKALFE